jgi:hypothetical protein
MQIFKSEWILPRPPPTDIISEVETILSHYFKFVRLFLIVYYNTACNCSTIDGVVGHFSLVNPSARNSDAIG